MIRALHFRAFFYLCFMTIEELEAYFTGRALPATYRLSRSHKITNVRQYVETNLMQAKTYGIDTKFGSAYKDLV
jgi:hypothetical protein